MKKYKCFHEVELTSECILEFAEKFFGYGSWENKYWAIGMEERGCNSGDKITDEAEAKSRIFAWSNSNSDLADLEKYCRDANLVRQAKSPTWDAIAELFFRLTDNKGKIDEYIGKRFLSSALAKKLTLIELQPLPCGSTKEKDWAFWEKILPKKYKNKNSWKKFIIEERIKSLARKIKDHKPKVLICYGNPDDPYWHQLAQQIGGRKIFKLTTDTSKSASVLKELKPQTSLLVLPHPGAIRKKGTSGRMFYRAVGEKLEKLLNNS